MPTTPAISGATRVVAVIGDPIEHSGSPAMHNAAFAALGLDWVMVPLRVAPAALVDAIAGLRAAGVVGASITAPHKHAMMAVCATLAPTALRAGAINCIALGGDAGVVGHNTDGDGALAAMTAAGWTIANATVVILGAGGVARALETSLAAAGAHTVVVARRPEAATWTSGAGGAQPWRADAMRAQFAAADVVIDATPTALEPASEPAFVDDLPLDALPARTRVMSLVYHRAPLLLARAAARGHAVLDGRGMLVHQGALAFQLWTGVPAPAAVMAAALDEMIARTG